MTPRLSAGTQQESLESSTKEPFSPGQLTGHFIAWLLLIFGGFMLLISSFGVIVLVTPWNDPHGDNHMLGTPESHRDFFIGVVKDSFILAGIALSAAITLSPRILDFSYRKKSEHRKKIVRRFGEKSATCPDRAVALDEVGTCRSLVFDQMVTCGTFVDVGGGRFYMNKQAAAVFLNGQRRRVRCVAGILLILFLMYFLQRLFS